MLRREFVGFNMITYLVPSKYRTRTVVFSFSFGGKSSRKKECNNIVP